MEFFKIFVRSLSREILLDAHDGASHSLVGLMSHFHEMKTLPILIFGKVAYFSCDCVAVLVLSLWNMQEREPFSPQNALEWRTGV